MGGTLNFVVLFSLCLLFCGQCKHFSEFTNVTKRRSDFHFKGFLSLTRQYNRYISHKIGNET